MLRVLPIRYSDVLGSPLIEEYAADCGIDAIGKPDPQVEMYEQMESIGLMRVFGLYRDALLIGFAAVLVSVLPHYGKKVATVESLYVTTKHRGLASGKLLKAVEAYAGASGCVSILYSAPALSDFSRMLANRGDYRRTSSVYCRRLA